MSIIAYIESNNGVAKKSAFEVISYAKNISNQLAVELIVVAVNINDTIEISDYGPDKIILVNKDDIKIFNPKISWAVSITSEKRSKNSRPIPFFCDP